MRFFRFDDLSKILAGRINDYLHYIELLHELDIHSEKCGKCHRDLWPPFRKLWWYIGLLLILNKIIYEFCIDSMKCGWFLKFDVPFKKLGWYNWQLKVIDK